MTSDPPQAVPADTQQRAARVVGGTYLMTNATAFFQNLYVLPHLIDSNDPAKTAANIEAHQLLFRLGIASDLLTFSILVVLIGATYVVLRRVNRELALLAAFWRIVETGIMVTIALHSITALQLLNGAAYEQVLGVDRLQALALSTLATQSAQYIAGYLFLGLGSTLFSYLWLRSRYIPKILAVWGLVGSALCAGASIVFIVLPKLSNLIWYIPIGTFELAIGFWLSIRGIRFSAGQPGRAVRA
jgi:hypothetical protein